MRQATPWTDADSSSIEPKGNAIEIETKMCIVSFTKIDSSKGLLLDDTKTLPGSVLTYHRLGHMTFIWEQFLKRYFIL